MNTIEELTILSEGRVRLRFGDGAELTVDLNPVIARGGIFESLSHPEYFGRVRIGPRGRSLVWPDELDFCADALRQQGEGILDVAS